MFSSTDERQVAQYRPDLPVLQKLGQFLIDYASRQTSFELSTNPLKAKWVRSSQARRGYLINNAYGPDGLTNR